METKKVEHKIVITPLKDLLNSNNAISKLEKALFLFVCSDDKDVQNFLRKDAITFEKSGKARTYLLIDNANGELLGYFTLAINSIKFGKQIRAEVKEQFEYDESNKSFKYMNPYVPAYLLALIGKDTAKYNSYLNNKYGTNYIELLKKKYGNSYKKHIEKMTNIAMPEIANIIKQSKSLVGGQLLYLDCDKKLVKFYESFGFTYFRDNEDDSSLMQLMLMI
jgi:hypothetical protein